MRDFLLLALSLALATPALAAEDEIIVTGRGLSAPPGTAAYGAVVIPRDRLTSEASGRIENILRDVAGFQQFRRTDSRAANPTSQGATLRALGGNASSRALVLLDGVPQADPFAGYIAWSALAPERLGSVRVTRGGGIGPFGAGAVAGTIELESAGIDDLPRLAGRALYGSRDSTELAAGLATRLGQGFVTVDGRWDRGDGYVLIPATQRGRSDVPAAYDAWSLGLRAVVPIGGDAELQARALVFDDNRLRGQIGADNRSRGGDAALRLLARGRWGVDALVYLQLRDFASGFLATSADRNTTTPSLDQFKTPAFGLGGKLELRPPTGPDNVLRFGADARYADGRTNELFRFQGSAFTRVRRAGGSTLTAGLFVEDDLTLGRLTLTGGARVDRWEINDGRLDEQDIGTGTPVQLVAYPDRAGWRPSFRGGALWKLPKGLDLRVAGYSGFRLPTLNELYRPFRVGADATAANAALDLEKLTGVEGGIDWRPLSTVRLSVTGFHNELAGAIGNATIGRGPGTFPQVGFVAAGGVFRQRVNFDAVTVTGIEVTAMAQRGAWSLSASYAHSDARVRASGIAAGLDGRRPAQTPQDQASATLAWRIQRADAALSLRYAGPQNEDDLGERRLPEALTVDASASLAVGKHLRLIGRAENIFDERVVSGISSAGVIDLGLPRTLWIGVGFALPR
ncbi:TonB-dependent receptor [alpha proteobacterium AAP81b]|nr:TonB-dependent receptor [alpha proteobacterium AAP81b]